MAGLHSKEGWKITPIRSFASATKDEASGSTINTRTKLPPSFYVPRAERGCVRPLYEVDAFVGETRLRRNSRTCPTRELNFQHAQWGRHKSPYRRFRHMANMFRAAGFQRLLFPDLLSVAAVATGLTYFNEVVAPSTGALALSMSPSAFAGATTAIGLLAGFRLNNSYGRYRDGRQVWGKLQAALRDMTRQSVLLLRPSSITTRNDRHTTILLQRAQMRLVRLCQALPVTMIFHVNDKGGHHNMKRKSKHGEASFADRVQTEFVAELWDSGTTHTDHLCAAQQEVVGAQWEADLERLRRVKVLGGNVPNEVVTCLAETVAACGDAGLHPIYLRELEAILQRLCEAIGGGERLIKTPLPTGFTRHSSRLLFLWSNSLPFALYPLLGPIGTLPTSLLTSYAVLGMEDISVQLEEPFDILPTRQYSDTIIQDIQTIKENFELPSSLTILGDNLAKTPIYHSTFEDGI